MIVRSSGSEARGIIYFLSCTADKSSTASDTSRRLTAKFSLSGMMIAEPPIRKMSLEVEVLAGLGELDEEVRWYGVEAACAEGFR